MNYHMNIKVSGVDAELLRNFLNHIHDESVEFKNVKVEEINETIVITKTELRKGINRIKKNDSLKAENL